MAVASAVSSPAVMVTSSIIKKADVSSDVPSITSDQLLPLQKGLAVECIYLGNVGNLTQLLNTNRNFDAVVFNSLRDPSKKVQITVAPSEGTGGGFIATWNTGYNLVDKSNLNVAGNGNIPIGSPTYSYVDGKSNNNCIVHFTEPLIVAEVKPTLENYKISCIGVAEAFAKTYDGILPGQTYNRISDSGNTPANILKIYNNNKNSLPSWHIQTGDLSNTGFEPADGWFAQDAIIRGNYSSSSDIYHTEINYHCKNKDGRLLDVDKEITNYDFKTNSVTGNGGYYFTEMGGLPIVSVDKSDYYNFIRSTGAIIPVQSYDRGYKDGQNNPTFKSFIVSSFDACKGFFDLPVLGEHITIGTLIGSFVGLGALFLLIKLFR